ncbi:MAG TPA: hypothetical protein VIL29_04780 [Pseudothermotoga sp.]
MTAKTNVSVNVLNAIRNSATQSYRNYVPYAESVADIRAIGAIIMDNTPVYNEFCYLVNRISEVKVVSKLFENPLRAFKKGKVDFGETVEEAFVELISVKEFDYAKAENQLFKVENPDIRTAFHPLNYTKFYPVTIKRNEVKKAFLSEDGVANLVAKIMEKIYTSVNYDEFQVMLYMIGKNLRDGHFYLREVDELTNDNIASITEEILEVSDDFTEMGTEYNLAGVRTHSKKDEQYLVISNKANAKMNVGVLASAFNMDKAEFMGHKINVKGFGKIDTDRLAELFADDPTYEPLTEAEIETLNKVVAVLLDKDWFMVFDNLLEMGEADNGMGLYRNYFYHVWKTFSVSPFSNAVAFISATPTVTSVTLSQTTASVSGPGQLALTASVVTENFASKAVEWSIDCTTEGEATVDVRGLVTIYSTAQSGDTIVVTATSVADGTKSASCTITVA